jgi:hypothetical protein
MDAYSTEAANKENIDEALFERLPRPNRPLSAKHNEKSKGTPKGRYRPNSANRATSGRRAKAWTKLPRDVNPILLSRIKP